MSANVNQEEINSDDVSSSNINGPSFWKYKIWVLPLVFIIIYVFILLYPAISQNAEVELIDTPPPSSTPLILSPTKSILPPSYYQKNITSTPSVPTITPFFTNVIPQGNIKVAVIEFFYRNDPKSDYFYEFYCNLNDCLFRTPEQDTSYFINWCGKDCRIEKKSFFSVFNHPEGITNVYPSGKNQAKYSYYSVYQVKNFYENEAKKYGVDLNIALEVKGPFILADKPPQRLRDQSPSLLEDFFDNEAKKNGADISHYDIINYLYFTSENYLVATANHNKTFSQAFISFDDIFGGIIEVTHEMGHVFGGYDTYQPGTWPCIYPEGFPEPNKTPLYPQSKACLMCKSVMLGEKITRGPTDFNEIIVCETEAKRFGWK